MYYVILLLVYLSGLIQVFYCSIGLDERVVIQHGPQGKPIPFWGYLAISVVWPVTLWICLYLRWLEIRDLHKQKTGGEL